MHSILSVFLLCFIQNFNKLSGQSSTIIGPIIGYK